MTISTRDRKDRPMKRWFVLARARGGRTLGPGRGPSGHGADGRAARAAVRPRGDGAGARRQAPLRPLWHPLRDRPGDDPAAVASAARRHRRGDEAIPGLAPGDRRAHRRDRRAGAERGPVACPRRGRQGGAGPARRRRRGGWCRRAWARPQPVASNDTPDGRALNRRVELVREEPAAQHPVHHGRRHRLDAAVDLPSRPDGRRDAQHRPDRPRRGDVHRLLCRAELHGRAQRLLHRHASRCAPA